MARPTIFSQDKADTIVKAIMAGNYMETAAAYAGISKNTLYDWLRQGRRERDRVVKNPRFRVQKALAGFVEFSYAVEKALAFAEVADLQKVSNATTEHWQAAAWKLERRHPGKYGRKDVLNVKMDAEIGKFLDLLEMELTQEQWKAVCDAVENIRSDEKPD